MNSWKWRVRLTVWTAIGLAAAGLVAWRMRPDAPAAMAADSGAAVPHLIPVRVIEAGSLAGPRNAEIYRGTVQAGRTSDLAFRRGGRVEVIRIREGDPVVAGQVLAELDASDVRAALERVDSQIEEAEAVLDEQLAGPRRQTIEAAESEVRRLEAVLQLAEATRDREQSLQGSSASSRQAWDEARFAVEQARAALAAARQQLDELREGTRPEQVRAQRARIKALRAQRDDLLVQLADCTIVAPFAGVIARRMADEGIVAGPERPILRVIEVDPLEARFGVAPADAALLAPGDQVFVQAGTERFAGLVARIEPDLDLTTRTQGLIVALPASAVKGRLVPGQTVSLQLADATGGGRNNPGRPADDGALWLPVQALSRSVRGLWSVMVVVPDEPAGGNARWVVERRDVPVLETESGLVRIGAGLVRPGDWIIAEGTHRVAPGMLVRPLFGTAEQPPGQSRPDTAATGGSSDDR